MRLPTGIMLITGLAIGAAVCGHLEEQVHQKRLAALQASQCVKSSDQVLQCAKADLRRP